MRSSIVDKFIDQVCELISLKVIGRLARIGREAKGRQTAQNLFLGDINFHPNKPTTFCRRIRSRESQKLAGSFNGPMRVNDKAVGDLHALEATPC